MKLHIRTITAVFTVLALLWTSLLLERAHSDFVPGGVKNDPVLTQHTCGATERHIPLSKLHPCIVCALGWHRAATPPAVYLPPGLSPISAAYFSVLDGHPHRIDYIFSGKRGPPSGSC